MKRLIQIIYDNSSSMNTEINGEKKYHVAQDLFEKEILPSICKQGDQIYLRLLRKSCHSEESLAEDLTLKYNNDKHSILNRISNIIHNQSTPLFYTIYDSIKFCKSEIADDYLIFVLTDGDDTCGVKINELISEDLLNKYVKFYNVKFLMLQLAISSSISRNNLSSITNRIGGQTVFISSTDSITERRQKIKKSLLISGFSKKAKLDQCFDSKPGFDLSWDQIEEKGISLHQAILLYHKGFLSWEPKPLKEVSQLEFSELKFLFAISVTTGLSDDMVKTMLSQLKAPYYYDFNCIYWDFIDARWKYFKNTPIIEQIENPESHNDENPEINFKRFRNNVEKEKYLLNHVYRIEYGETTAPTYILKEVDTRDWNIELKRGDYVKFK